MKTSAQILLFFGLFAQSSGAFSYPQYFLEVLETTFGSHRPVLRCDAAGANFGPSPPEFTLAKSSTGCAIFAEPRDACKPPIRLKPLNETYCESYYAVVSRGNCTFSEKAYNVQEALPFGFDAIIIYNDEGRGPPSPMSGSTHAADVDIPVIMINYACMQQIMGHFAAEHGYVITIKIAPGYYDLIKYLLPVVVIVGFCFIILFISLIIRLCRERRRLARKRLSRANLKKLPVKKYKKGDGSNDVCAVCLEDFQENEKVRILPCRHTYHVKCIDPWLTKNRKVCPICKRKVGPSSADSSDSETERNTTNNSVPSTSRDSDPLINNVVYASGSNTAPSRSATHPSILNIRWWPSASPTPSAPPSEPTPSQPLPSAPTPNFTSSANLTAESREVDEGPSRRSIVAQRLGNAFGRAVHSLRRLTRRSSNAHRRLENDAGSLSTIALDADMESQTHSNRFSAENNGYAATPNADANSLTTVHSNRYYVEAEVEPTPNEHRD